MKNLNEIENDINQIMHLRNDARKKAITETSLNLYHALKDMGYKVVERSFLKSFCSGGKTAQNEILNLILKELIRLNKITETEKSKPCIRFLRKDLLTFDFESYKTLMAKNGYKTYCYKWVYDNDARMPKKKLLGVSEVNAIDTDVLSETDLTETKSNTSLKHQGVYSNRSVSIAKSIGKFKIKAYMLL